MAGRNAVIKFIHNLLLLLLHLCISVAKPVEVIFPVRNEIISKYLYIIWNGNCQMLCLRNAGVSLSAILIYLKNEMQIVIAEFRFRSSASIQKKWERVFFAFLFIWTILLCFVFIQVFISSIMTRCSVCSWTLFHLNQIMINWVNDTCFAAEVREWYLWTL